MSCREFADFLSDYVSGVLPDPVQRSFEHHLGICENCQRYLRHYRESIALGRAAFDDLDATVPTDVPEDLNAAILAAR
jgi:anti-sigma factor RsiW